MGDYALEYLPARETKVCFSFSLTLSSLILWAVFFSIMSLGDSSHSGLSYVKCEKQRVYTLKCITPIKLYYFTFITVITLITICNLRSNGWISICVEITSIPKGKITFCESC